MRKIKFNITFTTILIFLLILTACQNYSSNGTTSSTPISTPTFTADNPGSSSTVEYEYDANTKMFWMDDPKGAVLISGSERQYARAIQTNDALRLQQQVPFTIIFPGYLPDDNNLKGLPALKMFSGVHSPDEIEVNIQYGIKNITRNMEIRQVNRILNLSPIVVGVEYTFLDIKGIKVLEGKDSDIVLEDGKNTLAKVFDYSWNQNNIGYQIWTQGFDQTETRKIAESMIE